MSPRPTSLHLFYEEPDPDRWVYMDRYPRRALRRALRGPQKPGGVMRWFLNLKAGLDLTGVPYDINNYRCLRNRDCGVACVVGKPHVIDKIPHGTKIIYGPGVAAHPYESSFWAREDISLVLLSCKWFKDMYERDLPRPIPTAIWYAGIETEVWKPKSQLPTNRLLVYDKIRWVREKYETELLSPIIRQLRSLGRDVDYIRYGKYSEEQYRKILHGVDAMIFLCEHETQGFAYLQALSSGIPIFAWDRGGFWQDPSMFPHRVQFQEVTSVPFFDERCGMKFSGWSEFESRIIDFLDNVNQKRFSPRDYVCENFNLSIRANAYLDLVSSVTFATP